MWSTSLVRVKLPNSILSTARSWPLDVVKRLVTRLAANRRYAIAGTLFLLISFVPVIYHGARTQGAVAAMHYPAIPGLFLLLFITGFVLAASSFTEGTARRRLALGALIYVLMGVGFVLITGLLDILAAETYSLRALAWDLQRPSFYLGLLLISLIWPLVVLDLLGVFVVFERL